MSATGVCARALKRAQGSDRRRRVRMVETACRARREEAKLFITDINVPPCFTNQTTIGA